MGRGAGLQGDVAELGPAEVEAAVEVWVDEHEGGGGKEADVVADDDGHLQLLDEE